jgi:hypothetical protein
MPTLQAVFARKTRKIKVPPFDTKGHYAGGLLRERPRLSTDLPQSPSIVVQKENASGDIPAEPSRPGQYSARAHAGEENAAFVSNTAAYSASFDDSVM